MEAIAVPLNSRVVCSKSLNQNERHTSGLRKAQPGRVFSQLNKESSSSNEDNDNSKPLFGLENLTLRQIVLGSTGLTVGIGAAQLLGGGGLGNGVVGGGSGGGGGGGGGWNFWSWDGISNGVAHAAEDDDDEDEDEDFEEFVEEEEKTTEKQPVQQSVQKKTPKEPKKPLVDDDSWEKHDLNLGNIYPLSRLSGKVRHKVTEVNLIDDSASGDKKVPKSDPFWDLLGNVRPGGIYTKEQLSEELTNLLNSGMLNAAQMKVVGKEDGTLRLDVHFKETAWQPSFSAKLVNVGILTPDITQEMDPMRQYEKKMASAKDCMVPGYVVGEVNNFLKSQPAVTARGLQRIRDIIQKWYFSRGYVCAQVVNFGDLNTKEIVCEVMEGQISKVELTFLDKSGEPFEGNTNLKIVEREIPQELSPGLVFNMEAARKALHSINSLQLFANIEVMPKADEQVEGGIIVEIKLRELDPLQAELNTEWSIAPGDTGKPSLVSIVPGGTASLELRNIQGLNRTLTASASSSNLLNPQDELEFKLDYRQPYLDGLEAERNRIGNVSVFNNRKVTAVFAGGPNSEEVPAVWVDRFGVKATVTESLKHHSKLTYGAVLQEVTTRDENSAPCTQALKGLPSGMLSPIGPPTTLSGNPLDRAAYLQASLVRDNTRHVRGVLVGDRDIFQVDQGLFIGSKNPFFNRHQLTLTRFIQLTDTDLTNDIPPWIGVLHAHFGNCLGDLANYDAFAIGGPYSVRGYNMGEIGASKRVLELAGEVRVPVKNTQAYAFGEFAHDLGGSKDLAGNPTAFFGRKGYGGSVGVGVKLPQVRAELVRDCNVGNWSFFLRYGERF